MSRSGRLAVVLALNLALVAGLVTVGISAHSLGVLAEGVDYIADAAAIGGSLLAISLTRRPPTQRNPNGYPRATAIAALVNTMWLLAVNLLVIVGAVHRLTTTTNEVQGLPVLIVSAIAALVMLVATLILGGEIDEGNNCDNGNLNMRSVLLDTASDAAAATAVAITGAVILAAGGLYWLDPAVALILSAVITYHALRLLRQVATALRISKTDL